jgi:glycosyltransferase involved in cell wall biosynthesis
VKVAKNPLISVITPVYNGEKFVGRTIASVLGQTCKDFEYILINDASTDSSLDVIRSFDDARIKVVENEVNSRLVVSRNRGLEIARGKYVALLDHDDIALPHRLEMQLAVMEANKDLLLIGSHAKYINADDKVIKGRKDHRCLTPEHSRAKLLFRNHFINSTVFFRQMEKKVMFSDQFQLSEDYDFIERYATLGKIHVIRDVLVHYRVHDNNYGSKMQAETQEGCNRIKARQLERLGVPFDDELMRLHAQFEYGPFPYSKEMLKSIANWIESIKSGNKKSKVFDETALNDVIHDELLKIAEDAAKKSHVEWSDIFNSPYRDVLLKPPSGAVRAAIKYMLRRRS